MKIAYLITAHEQPALVARAIRLLAEPDSLFFVHVDRRADIGPFERALRDTPARLLERRVAVHWGAWSIAESTLRLLRAALAADPGIGRVQLLSGSCFPVKSKAEIRRRLVSSPLEFMTVNRRLEPGCRYYWWIDQWHFPDLLPLRVFEKRRLYRYPRRAIGRVLPRGWPFAPLVPFKGWSWWCLTRACAEHVLRFTEQRPEVVRYFRHTRNPDETFFATVIKNSPFAERISHDMQEGDVSGNHCVIWERDRPATLREAHWERLMAGEACFARKFDQRLSGPLLDRLEALLSAA